MSSAERSEEERLRAEIDALDALLAGQLPAEIDPQTLFEVDLLDESARAARVEALRRSIAAAEVTPPVVPDAGASQPAVGDAGVPIDASDTGRMDGGRGSTSHAGTPRGAGGTTGEPRAERTVDGGALDGGVPDGGPVAVDTTVRESRTSAPPDPLAALRLERDRARLAFLTLPASERAAVTEAVGRRRHIAAEEEASRAEARRASADAERASEARQQALDRASATSSAVGRDLLAERARIENARAELARWQGQLARQRQAIARHDAERLELAHAVERQLGERDFTEREADARYDELVDALIADRQRLDDALDRIGTEPDAPHFEPGLDVELALYRNRPERTQLVGALDAFDRDRSHAIDAERRLRWERAERFAGDVRKLDRLRVALLPHMTQARRETMLGLGREGLAQAGRELDQIRLLTRFWIRRAWHRLPAAPAHLGALLARSSSRNELFGVLALAFALSWTWRRRESITSWLRGHVHARTGQGRWVEVVRPFWDVIGALIVPLLVVAGLYALFRILGDLTSSVALVALRIVVLGTAWFFVTVTAVARLFTSRLRHGATRAALARRIFASTRLVLGFGLLVGVALQLGELLVGRGYLYTLVVDLAWLGLLPLAAFLIRRWSQEVTDAHAERHPDGICARRLAHKDTRWRRYVLTLPAAAQLTVSAVTTGLQELALRFDQARRAVAFLSRRRLEKQAEGTADSLPPKPVPEAVRETFSGAPCRPELEIDRFPELARIAEVVESWKEGGPGFTTALVGERGIGKTSWMRALARRSELESAIVDVPHGLGDPRDRSCAGSRRSSAWTASTRSTSWPIWWTRHRSGACSSSTTARTWSCAPSAERWRWRRWSRSRRGRARRSCGSAHSRATPGSISSARGRRRISSRSAWSSSPGRKRRSRR